MSQLVIYFTLHAFPEELETAEFRAHLDASNIFTFRGAAHEASMLRLLKSRSIPTTLLRFHPEPFLEELLVSPLTIREAVQDEVIRRYLCRIMRRAKSYQELVDFDKEAKNMSKEDLERCLARFDKHEGMKNHKST
jgi:hypothetical protein